MKMLFTSLYKINYNLNDNNMIPGMLAVAYNVIFQACKTIYLPTLFCVQCHAIIHQ